MDLKPWSVVSVEGMSATPNTVCDRIRITKGLSASQYVYTTVSVDEALKRMGKEHDLYECTKSDHPNAKYPQHNHIGLVRVYGDIEFYSDNKKQSVEWDATFESVLRQTFNELSHRVCLMKAPGLVNSDKGKYKISWRFVLPDVCASKWYTTQYARTVIGPKIKSILETKNITTVIELDWKAYNPEQKMRMLGSSKDGEKRPLKLVEGTPVDTLITYIPDSCVCLSREVQAVEEKKPAEKKKTATIKKPKANGETLKCRDWNFAQELSGLMPIADIDDRLECIKYIWAMWSTEQSDRMLDLINTTCSKSKKYKMKDQDGTSGADWVKARINDDRTNAVTLASVVWRIKRVNPVAVKQLYKKFPVSYLCELVGKSLKPKNVMTYDERFVMPLPIQKHDTLILESMLGTGKTIQLMGSKKHNIAGLMGMKREEGLAVVDGKWQTMVETEELMFPRVLFISGRKSFTHFALGELKEQGINFENYEGGGTDLAQHDRLFIQVESLWKLHNGFKKYDLVIIDESETITHQLYSVQTNNENMIDNHIIFERVVSTANKLIVADAFVSDRSFSFVKELRNPAHTVFIQNTRVPYKREAIELRPKGRDVRVPDVDLFIKRIMDAIEAKRRIVIVWTSKRKGLAFEKDFLMPLKEAGLKWKYYHGDSTKAERADLGNVLESWKTLDVLMHTTSISVGVSYNPECDLAKFDEIFLYGCSASATPRDVAQSLLRCRELKLNRLTYCMDLRCSGSSLRGMDAIRQYIVEKKKRLQTDHPITQWKTAPKWAEDNYAYNKNEVAVSKAEYAEVLRHYLKWCGYTIKTDDGELIDEDDTQYALTSIDALDYDDIEDVNYQEAEEIKFLMKRDEAEPAQRLALKKFNFKKQIKEEFHETAKTIWDDYMESPMKETLFWNMCREKHTTTEKTVEKEAEARFLVLASNHTEQRNCLDKVLKLLGMTFSQDKKTVTHDEWVKLIDSGKALEAEIIDTFGVRKSRRTKDAKFDASHLHDLVASVFDAWAKSDVKTVNQRRKRVDGKQVWVYDYEFIPREAWDAIRDKEVVEAEAEAEPKVAVYQFIDE